ncbi:mitochondrial 54S ribosomal protein YmL33 [Pichia kluyveri]|uniref:Large ribosomal subunit protein uL30m n=1 Tax=Pichia kluyveri TaxID=36015 RepID=A0AAV5RBH7_PICKL|nr:mitochondrial 54S ribosomal protein YmL33 [Pichia kluyveri]
MSAPAKYFKVTQLRSTIGLPSLYKETLHALGLRRRHQTVYHKITPQQAGQIARVKELVKVELSPVYKDKADMRAERKSDPGFVVIPKSI